MATTLNPPPAAPPGEEPEVLDTSALLGDDLLGGVGAPEGDEPRPEDFGPIEVPLRPLLVAGFAMLGTALTVGGIFGSWPARLLCVVAAAAGIGWSWVCARSRRRALLNGLLPVVALGLAVLSLVVGSDGPAELPSLVRDAIDAGRALRPPIPFDAGWRPILIAVMVLLGFAAGSAGTVLDRPRLALVIPLPLLGLTAISQPPTGQALAGLLAVVPVIAGLTVLFGDQGGVSGLTREFEFRRIFKAGSYMVGILAAIIALNTAGAGLLFPEPAYDPAQKPQKPKPVPLNAADDRVLFEISGPITGPWKVGSLDDYDGKSWRLPPYDPKTFQKVPADGVIDKLRKGDVAVKFTIRDFGTNASLPGVTGPTRIDVSGQKLVFDPRAGSFRVPSGRVPSGLVYTEYLPTYPTPEELRTASGSADLDKLYTRIPKAPPAVRNLLEEAPVGKWDRLDYLLKELTAVEIAVGAGTPKDITPAKVQQLLVGNHEGSPYELVAARAMLARWAGVPSRIGFGFDGANKEGDAFTVRPANASQWLEVYFEGKGWIPIVTQPPRAKASLDNDEARFNPTIQAGDDVAVQIYVPVKVRNFRALYQQIRDVLFTLLPILFLLVAARLALPWAQKTWRRAKRQRWARTQGPAAQIAVEYCEWRDLATDLGVGDPYATPIEFLNFVVEDDEHAEFAWLVTKALYGELYEASSADDVAAARELGDSLRARLFKAQPFQTRVLSYLTRLSLQQPYSSEVPN